MYAGSMSMFPQEEPARQAYGDAQAPATQISTYTGNGTSSAFSASALPHEDWTQIADLAERRRIQNRIAQRNYRKKLKRRLEDLERRAGSNEPEDEEAADKNPSPPPTKAKRTPSKAASKPKTKPRPQETAPETQMHLTPPMENNDDYLFAPYARQNSHTPPMYHYSAAYPPPEETLSSSYDTTSPYQTPATTHDSYAYPTLAPLSSTMPSMSHFSDAYKQESFSSDGGFNLVSQHGNMWPYWNAMDSNTNAMAPYARSNAATPPLSHSFEQSANCSETGLEPLGLPTTPLSMSESPSMMPHMVGEAARELY